jgi:uncharacterized protein
VSFFEIYLPIAEVSIDMNLLLAIGLVTGVCTGFFGLGGSLIALPLLFMIGIPVNVAVASVTNQMTAGTLSSLVAYSYNGKVDYRLGSLMIMGGIGGTLIGVVIFNYLALIGRVETMIPLLLLVLLILISLTVVEDIIAKYWLNGRYIERRNKALARAIKFSLPLQTKFISVNSSISMFSPILVGLIGGILIALLGLGGAFIMIPLMLYLLRTKESYTSGTVLFQIVFTSVFANILHALSFQCIDIVLSVILILSTVVGAQIGAQFADKIQPEKFRILYAMLMLSLCTQVAYNLTKEPSEKYQIIEKIK